MYVPIPNNNTEKKNSQLAKCGMPSVLEVCVPENRTELDKRPRERLPAFFLMLHPSPPSSCPCFPLLLALSN